MTSEEKSKNVRKWSIALIACAAIGLCSIVALNVVLLIKLLPEHYETALGDFPSPMVLNRVPGYTGPAARLGEVTVLRQNRCVNRDTKIAIQTFWVPGPDNKANGASNRETIDMNSAKGCSSITMALQMPENVTPGNWYISGIVRDTPSGDPRYWTSEIFVVVP